MDITITISVIAIVVILGLVVWSMRIVMRPAPPPPGTCSQDDWCWQNPLPHGDDNGAVCFKKTEDGQVHAWMLVGGVRILHSDDGGQTWEPQDTGLQETRWPENLFDLCFVDTTHGWAIGSKVILHTVDGGNSWVRQALGPDTDVHMTLISVTFVDQQNGWIVGSVAASKRGYVFHTEDEGQTWSLQYESHDNARLRDIVFVDASRGWAVGDSLTILRTTDGGTTWTQFPSALIDDPEGIGVSGNLYCVTFTMDGVYGWAMLGYGSANDTLFRTLDGGESWSVHSMHIWNFPFAELQSWHHEFDIQMVDAWRGWAVGCGYLRSAPINDDFGTILRTEDGGHTWTEQLGWLGGASSDGYTNGMNRRLGHVEAFDQEVWVTGQLGTLLHTTNGGDSWFEDTHYETTDNLVALGLMGEQNLVALGWHGIMRTEDGVAWREEQTVLPKYAEYRDMATYGQHLWVVGRIHHAMGLVNYPCLYHSSDNGQSWSLQSSLVDLAGNDFSAGVLMHMSIGHVIFIDDSHGWATGHFVNYADPNDIHINHVLFRTTDGGVDWVQLDTSEHPDIDTVFFVDTNRGWATTKTRTEGILLHTNDGGDSWNEQYTDTDAHLAIVTFVDTDYGWAVGDGATVVATTDGGQSWSEIHPTEPCFRWTKRPLAVVFHDHLSGWIVGKSSVRGMILETNDGGATWAEHDSGSMAYLTDIAVNASGEAWVSGWGGTVLHYAKG